MKQKGFTLIELLVVIAIIGILASVVLASLNTARDSGQDAATKSSLNNMRAQAELFYSSNGDSYGTFTEAACPTTAAATPSHIFETDQFVNSTNSLPASTTTRCASTTNAWAAAYALNATNTYYCVDSTGAAEEGTAASADATIDTNTECSLS